MLDVDFRIPWLTSLDLWSLATAEIDAALNPPCVTEAHRERRIESRCIEMELHTYGCIDARLP